MPRAKRNPPTEQRKTPRQARSKELVRCLLEATARVLVEEGWDAANTNRIAAVAGVSVGSLYQYFPNKAALVKALLDAHLLEAASLRPPELNRSDLPLRERLALVVRWHLAVHASHPRLHQLLTAHAHQVLGVEAVVALERRYAEVVTAALLPYAAQMRPANLHQAGFLVARCIEAMTHGVVQHHPEWTSDPRLADEMTELLTGYLQANPLEKGPA